MPECNNSGCKDGGGGGGEGNRGLGERGDGGSTVLNNNQPSCVTTHNSPIPMQHLHGNYPTLDQVPSNSGKFTVFVEHLDQA